MIDTKKIEITSQYIERRKKLHNVYYTEDGINELFLLLFDLGCFREITPEELSKRNYGIRKLEELGFLDLNKIKSLLKQALEMPFLISDDRENNESIKKFRAEYDPFEINDSENDSSLKK